MSSAGRRLLLFAALLHSSLCALRGGGDVLELATLHLGHDHDHDHHHDHGHAHAHVHMGHAHGHPHGLDIAHARRPEPASPEPSAPRAGLLHRHLPSTPAHVHLSTVEDGAAGTRCARGVPSPPAAVPCVDRPAAIRRKPLVRHPLREGPRCLGPPGLSRNLPLLI